MILAFAFFMEMMDSTVIATSLPAIASGIGVKPVTLKLALTSYLVASASSSRSAAGWRQVTARKIHLPHRTSRCRPVPSPARLSSLPEFVIARFLQGIGGSMMTPVGRLVLVRAVPKSEFVSAMTWLTIPGS